MEPIEQLQDIATTLGPNIPFHEYLKNENLIREAILQSPEEDVFRIALLGSFTLKPLDLALTLECAKENFLTKVYLANFGQLQEEILNPNSDLYKFKPQITFCFTKPERLVPNVLESGFGDAEEKMVREQILLLHSKLQEISSSVMIFSNFITPIEFPFSSHPQNPTGEIVEKLNHVLRDIFLEVSDSGVLDLESLAQYHGKQNTRNSLLYFMSDIFFSENFLPLVAKKIASVIKFLKFKPKKCLVLDCDNTLWGGIVGELGWEGIKLSNRGQGSEFYEFQKRIKVLFDQGIILAINSRNNLEDVAQVLDLHPHMLLRKKHFAAMQINWKDKAFNIKEIAKELNIGLDSIVFVDDDPHQCKLIKDLVPEVEIVDLPENPIHYAQTIQELTSFERLKTTWEDLNRGKMYAAQKERKNLKVKSGTLESYLKSLKTIVRISPPSENEIPRVVQLTQRTNQFNLTTRRYNELQIRDFVLSHVHRIYCLKSSDIFGDNGLVGVAIIHAPEKKLWNVDSFLISCRVIGRQIEDAFLNFIIKDGIANSVKLFNGLFLASPKNDQVKDFYLKHGFSKTDETPSRIDYCLNSISFKDRVFVGLSINPKSLE